MEINLNPVEASEALSEQSDDSIIVEVRKRPSRAKPKPVVEEVKPIVTSATPKPRAKPKAKILEVPSVIVEPVVEHITPVVAVASPKPRAKPKTKYLEVPAAEEPKPEPPSEPVKMKSALVSCPHCNKQMPAKSLKYYHALKCKPPADPTPTQQSAPVSTTVCFDWRDEYKIQAQARHDKLTNLIRKALPSIQPFYG
jgi:hypothetical protein